LKRITSARGVDLFPLTSPQADNSQILCSSLYVAQRFDDDSDEESAYKGKDPIPYGKRVKKLFARADIKEIMAKEMQERQGRTLVIGMAKNFLIYLSSAREHANPLMKSLQRAKSETHCGY
jgi:hypothetical protein